MAVPRMAVLVALGLLLASPVSPVEPEFPVRAVGLATAVERAGPVLPVLVALVWEEAAPELPLVVTGLLVRLAAPPAPPLASLVATPEPPRATGAPVTLPPRTMLAALPPPAVRAMATPALPPRPPTTAALVVLMATPVLPESPRDDEAAPELAKELAVPMAVALPVGPLPPELPEVTLAPTRRTGTARLLLLPNTLAMPRMPVFRAKGLEVGVPGVPGVPEVPEVELGLEKAEEMAAPVLPVLVALDWLATRPESPETAAGFTLRVAAPPAPPLAAPVATPEPPVAVAPTVGAMTTLTAAPPLPEAASVPPPEPPSPPLTAALVVLAARPVSPETAVASDAAPELALLVARPTLLDAPVAPLCTVVVGWTGGPDLGHRRAPAEHQDGGDECAQRGGHARNLGTRLAVHAHPLWLGSSTTLSVLTKPAGAATELQYRLPPAAWQRGVPRLTAVV